MTELQAYAIGGAILAPSVVVLVFTARTHFRAIAAAKAVRQAQQEARLAIALMAAVRQYENARAHNALVRAEIAAARVRIAAGARTAPRRFALSPAAGEPARTAVTFPGRDQGPAPSARQAGQPANEGA